MCQYCECDIEGNPHKYVDKKLCEKAENRLNDALHEDLMESYNTEK